MAREPMVCARESLPGHAPDNVIEYAASTRCTRELPGSELTHLTEMRDGRLAMYDPVDGPDDVWSHAIITLADCSLGDRVYLNVGGDIDGDPPMWMVHEVVAG